jgi:hypothetical protein
MKHETAITLTQDPNHDSTSRGDHPVEREAGDRRTQSAITLRADGRLGVLDHPSGGLRWRF